MRYTNNEPMRSIAQALIALIIAVACTQTTLIVSATQLPEGIDEQLSFEVSPQLPGPNEAVTIVVRSFSTNLNAADISWFVNGALITRGTGQTSFSFRNGNAGQTTKVDVFIVKSGGGELARSFAFAPADLELVFEADTYVPPFYKGRSVFTHQADYHVVAIPKFIGNSGNVIPADQLVYEWRINDRVVQDKSGFGRNVFTGTGELVSRPFTIGVEATDQSGVIVAEKRLLIEPYEAETLIYEDNPLYGVIFERAIDDTFKLDRQEVALQAIPFFFSESSVFGRTLEYSWRIAGQLVIQPKDQVRMVVRNVDNVEGTSMINLFVESPAYILQAAETSAQLQYDEI